MKTFFYLCLFTFIHVWSFAQTNWAPIGSSWYYSFSSINPGIESYTKISTIKDTSVNSVNCKMLIISTPDNNGSPNVYYDTVFMYDENNKVYYFKSQLNKFCLLYDFNINTGGFWNLDEFPPSNNAVYVDSTGTININGFYKKIQYIHSNNVAFSFEGRVVEGIGNLNYMFPQIDFSPQGPLRCYQDFYLGYYNNNYFFPCDTVFGSIKEIKSDSFIEIYPNPFNNYVNIHSKNQSETCIIHIYNMQGCEIYKGKFINSHLSICTDFIPSGAYFCLISSNEIQYCKKIIKN